MNNTATYLIAKYIPDLRRMEPRNIGIILWVNGKSFCSFLAPEEAGKFVNERETYERWIHFWTERVNSGEVRIFNGPRIPVSSDQFLESFKLTQKGNYVLDEGGVLIDKISTKDAKDAVQFLFTELVSTHPSASSGSSHDRLAATAINMLQKAGITERDDYSRSKEIECNYHGIPQPLKFHHYLGNGKPETVIQQVHIQHRQNVNSTAWMFERVKDTFRGVKTGAIIDTTDIDTKLPSVDVFINVLRQLAQILDVAKEDKAIEYVKKLVR